MSRFLTTSLKSVLTRPNDTTAYAQNDLIASSATAGSIVVPFFTVPEQTRAIEIIRGRLITNLTTGFTTFAGHIELFSGQAPPTFTNGDNAAFAVATGAAEWVAHMTTDVAGSFHQMADGAPIPVGNGGAFSTSAVPVEFERGHDDKLYWAMRETDATGFTPIANQTFTLYLDVLLHQE